MAKNPKNLPKSTGFQSRLKPRFKAHVQTSGVFLTILGLLEGFGTSRPPNSTCFINGSPHAPLPGPQPRSLAYPNVPPRPQVPCRTKLTTSTKCCSAPWGHSGDALCTHGRCPRGTGMSSHRKTLERANRTNTPSSSQVQIAVSRKRQV